MCSNLCTRTHIDKKKLVLFLLIKKVSSKIVNFFKPKIYSDTKCLITHLYIYIYITNVIYHRYTYKYNKAHFMIYCMHITHTYIYNAYIICGVLHCPTISGSGVTQCVTRCSYDTRNLSNYYNNPLLRMRPPPSLLLWCYLLMCNINMYPHRIWWIRWLINKYNININMYPHRWWYGG